VDGIIEGLIPLENYIQYPFFATHHNGYILCIFTKGRIDYFDITYYYVGDDIGFI
jgi:hypothetical protein